MIAITPLEQWIRGKAHIPPGSHGGSFTEALQNYQLQRLNETINYASRNTTFYQHHLSSLPSAPLSALSDISRIPFTTPSDLTREPFRLLAVRQDDVAHIVTLRTSGSTGKPKRLFFTEDDLELTIDFFHHGMSTLVRPGQKVAVLLPSEQPHSVGDLLIRGLRRMDVNALPYGPVRDPLRAARAIATFGADCLVGIPTQVLAMARSSVGSTIVKGSIGSVLLSTDYVPQSIAGTLEKVWGCKVFNHYGMTEMGLGGGVECEALNGYHLREADLYFEVVDYQTGMKCPDGVIGEVVFTTLTRRGMPLIRYRTGDIARIIPEPCSCGTLLRRMERVRGRWEGAVSLGSGSTLTLPEVDEMLFSIADVLDYRIVISQGPNATHRMEIDIYTTDAGSTTAHEVEAMLSNINSIQKSIARGRLSISSVRFSAESRWCTNGVTKRKIITADAST